MYIASIEDVSGERRLRMHKLEGDDSNKIENMKQRLVFETKAPEAVSVDMLTIKDELFAFTTVKHEPGKDTINTGSSLYRISFYNNTFDKTQTIHLPFAQSSVIW